MVNWGRLGGVWGVFERVVGRLGASLGRLGASWGVLEASVGRFGERVVAFYKICYKTAVNTHMIRQVSSLASSYNRPKSS